MNKPTKKKKKTPEGMGEIFNQIISDSDFINSEKYDNSLEKFLTDNPDGVPDSTACKLLMLEVREHKRILSEAERIIRQHLEQ